MDNIGCDAICRNHSARSERDQYRICPTKLSKAELENLYFALLEKSYELKKTINGQQDRIKVLSTKVQRLGSAQKVLHSEERRGCCAATKATVSQQKELIQDLKYANERMADRIRKLNMRLCSAKQFCKTATPRCLRCSTATSPYLIKHSPHSFKPQSQSSLKLAVSYQNLSRDTMVTKYVQTESHELTQAKEDNKPCEDNRCKTFIDELKQKIENLQEELSHSHDEYSNRISTLEQEVIQTRADNVRMRSERIAGEHDVMRREERIALLVTNLRAAEGDSSELRTQLSIERRRVAELETRLKAATMSNRVTQTIEDTLTSIQESNKTPSVDVTLTCACSPRSVNADHNNSYTGLNTKNTSYDETKLSKSMTDDSGYVDKSQELIDDQSLNKIIDELTKRIMVLQTQVDALTISPPENNTQKVRHSFETEDYSNTSTEMVSFLAVSNKTEPIINIELVPSQDIETKTPKAETKADKVLQNEQSVGRITKTDQRQENKEEAKKNVEMGKENIPKEKDVQTRKESLEKKDEKTKVCDEKEIRQGDAQNKPNDEKLEDTSSDRDQAGKRDDRCREKLSPASEEKTYTIPARHRQSTEKTTTTSKGIIVKDTKETENIPSSGKSKLKKSSSKENPTVPDDKVKVVAENKNVEVKAKVTEHVGVKLSKVIKMSKVIKSVGRKANVPKETLARAETDTQNQSTGEEATYTVDYDKSNRASSPDNTDYEISSMTDFTEEKEPKSPPHIRRLWSPGEQKYGITQSESCTTLTNHSLSEGEIPVTTVRRKSYGDKPRADQSIKATEPKMEDTLQAITEELARCKRLLFSQRSQDNTKSAVM